MSALGDIEAAGAALLVEAGKALAEHIWRSVTGHTDHDADKKAIAKITADAHSAMVTAALVTAQRLADQAGYAVALAELGLAAERMRLALTDEAIEAQRTVPKLEGLDIEIVPHGSLDAELALPPSTAPELQPDDEDAKP